MKYPNKTECLELFDTYKVPDNIKRHCLKVTEVAVFLAKQLKKKIPEIDVDLVESLALLHDALKHATLPREKLEANPLYKSKGLTKEQEEIWKQLHEEFKGMHETAIVARLLENKYPEFAGYIEHFGKMEIKPMDTMTWEHILVHYADWRVFVDNFTDMRERFESFEKRYPDHIKNVIGEKTWKELKEHYFAIEKKLFAKLDFTPEQLEQQFHAYENRSFYDQHAQSFIQRTEAKEIGSMLDVFCKDLPKDAKILDVGCGFGRDAGYLMQKGYTNIIGLDHSKELLKEAKKRFPDVKFVQGDFFNLPFKEKEFDAVLANAVLLLFPKKLLPQALSEFKRVLKPKGMLAAAVKQGTEEGYQIHPHDKTKAYRAFYTKDEFVSIIKKAKFNIQHTALLEDNREPNTTWICVTAQNG